MDSSPSRESVRPFPIIAMVFTLGIAWAVAGGGPIFGGSRQDGGPGGPFILVAGGYSCSIGPSPYYPYPQVPGPELPVLLSHNISVSATGGVTGGCAGPTSGPGIGGRFPVLTPPSVPSGFGVGNTFDGGTVGDCLRFANAIDTVARRLGCVTSDVGEITLYPTGRLVQFSFVCEGPAGEQLHTIGDLSRAVVELRL